MQRGTAPRILRAWRASGTSCTLPGQRPGRRGATLLVSALLLVLCASLAAASEAVNPPGDGKTPAKTLDAVRNSVLGDPGAGVLGVAIESASGAASSAPEDETRPQARGEEGGPPAAAARPTVGDYYRQKSEARAAADGKTTADTANAAGSDDSKSAPGLIERYLRALGWLVVVVVIGGAGVIAYRKIVRRDRRIGGGRLVEIVARTALTQRQQIVVVRISERVLVLGVSPDRIQTLTELTDPRDAMRAGRGGSFSEQLSAADEDDVDRAAGEDAEEPALEPYRREIERLKTMVGNWRLTTSRKGGV